MTGKEITIAILLIYVLIITISSFVIEEKNSSYKINSKNPKNPNIHFPITIFYFVSLAILLCIIGMELKNNWNREMF